MARTPDGPPPPPVVQRLWIRYAKRGRLRFSSHRDFQRALERAVRRAGVPIAFSAGFSPHPKISFANAAPTGMASEAEYLEIGLVRDVDPSAVREALDAALPPGLDVLEVIQAPERTEGGLVDRLQASMWHIGLPGVDGSRARAAVSAFLAAGEIIVERTTKTGRKAFDARGAVGSMDMIGDPPPANAAAEEPCAILQVVVHHTTPIVRPDDVLTGLRLVADLAPPSPPMVTRLAQGPLDAQGAVADPFAPFRDDVAARTAAGAQHS